MRRAIWLTAACALSLAASPALADKQKVDHVYGPEPSWDEFRQIGEAAIIARLIDPESARITWRTGIYKGGFTPLFAHRVSGYAACGSVNAKNRMGGYTGATTFVVVIDYGRALLAEMDTRAGGLYDAACAKAIAAGKVPAPPSSAGEHGTASSTALSDTSSPPLANAATGLTLRAMPDGAYVAAVVPGSPAATAGLKPGMVVSSVNAIPLAGMGDAMLKVVDAAGPDASLKLVGGTTIKLGVRP